MKPITLEEFALLAKSDQKLYDSFKEALGQVEGKTVAEVAASLGYQIETPDLQAHDDDSLADVNGGFKKNTDDSELIDLFPDLFPNRNGDINFVKMADISSSVKQR